MRDIDHADEFLDGYCTPRPYDSPVRYEGRGNHVRFNDQDHNLRHNNGVPRDIRNPRNDREERHVRDGARPRTTASISMVEGNEELVHVEETN